MSEQKNNPSDSSEPKAKKLKIDPLAALEKAAKASPKDMAKKSALTTKKTTKKRTKKSAEKAPPPPPPREGRVVNVISTPTISASVPTAPKRIKPQYASFRSSRKSLVNPRRVRGGSSSNSKQARLQRVGSPRGCCALPKPARTISSIPMASNTLGLVKPSV